MKRYLVCCDERSLKLVHETATLREAKDFIHDNDVSYNGMLVIVAVDN